MLQLSTYLHVIGQHNIQTNLIFSKMRLIPVILKKKQRKIICKDITLPRLGLLAVLIGVRACNFVTKELKLPIIIWTDSECVLHWMTSII